MWTNSNCLGGGRGLPFYTAGRCTTLRYVTDFNFLQTAVHSPSLSLSCDLSLADWESQTSFCVSGKNVTDFLGGFASQTTRPPCDYSINAYYTQISFRHNLCPCTHWHRALNVKFKDGHISCYQCSCHHHHIDSRLDLKAQIHSLK